MTENRKVIIVKELRGCARCGRTHFNLIFKKFTDPIIESDGTVFNYYAMCPTLDEPIINNIINKDTGELL